MDWVIGIQRAIDYIEENITDELAKEFENITIPAHTYVVCETERSKYPTLEQKDLRKKIVTEWLPSSGYILADAPEIAIIHWYGDPNRDKRYIEIWLPVEKG